MEQFKAHEEKMKAFQQAKRHGKPPMPNQQQNNTEETVEVKNVSSGGP
jgi:hypothetical protein